MALNLHAWLEAMGFMLLHSTWQGALIAGLYKAITLVRPRLMPQSRYALGLIALQAVTGLGLTTLILEYARLAGTATPVAANTTGSFRQLFDMTPWLSWLDAVWLFGVIALSIRTLRDLRRIHFLSVGALPAPEAIARRFKDTLNRLVLSRRVHLRMHPLIDGPFVVGIVRSVIYLPMSATSTLSPDQLDAVIAHELEHIRRADYAWNLLQTLIEILFFYHPMVRWIGMQVREQRELCCDDAAVQTCRDPLVYATALFSLAQSRRLTPSLAMALSHCETGPSLVLRMGRILGETPVISGPTRRFSSRGWTPLALAILCLGLLFAQMNVVKHQLPKMPSLKTPVATSMLDKVQLVAPVKASLGEHLQLRRKTKHTTRAALATQSLSVPANIGTIDVSQAPANEVSGLIAKVKSSRSTIYLFDSRPQSAGVHDFLKKDHDFDLGVVPPGSHPIIRVEISPVSAKDGDYTAGKPASGYSKRLYKMVVIQDLNVQPLSSPPEAS